MNVVRALLLAGLVVISPCTMSAEDVIQPQGELADVETRVSVEAMQELGQGSSATRKQMIESVRSQPERYAPPVFYALSKTLFDEDEKEQAVFWFYFGQVRGRFDANRCADPTARQAIAVLNQQYGGPINQYAFKNIPLLESLVPRAVQRDVETPYAYDHRWINLHGMAAVTGSDTPASLPKDQWAAIAEQTRRDYLEGFEQAMRQMKAAK